MDSDADSDVVHDDHPPEFIIHAVDDLAPPPARAPAPPPRILPLAAFQPPRPPPPCDEVKTVRAVLFMCKVSCFAAIVIASSATIYFMVHPNPGESIADERSGVRLMCGLILAAGVIWLLLSYFSCNDKCVIIDDEEQGLNPLTVD